MNYQMLFAVWTGLEPATPCVTGMYSNQLNYHTVFFDSQRKGISNILFIQIFKRKMDKICSKKKYLKMSS